MDKNCMYQIYELRDEMKKAIANSEAVEESEKLLVATILDSKNADRFQDFTKDLSSNWPGYESDRTHLRSRLKKLNRIIEKYEAKDESSELVKEIVSLVLEGIGAVKAEAPKTDA